MEAAWPLNENSPVGQLQPASAFRNGPVEFLSSILCVCVGYSSVHNRYQPPGRCSKVWGVGVGGQSFQRHFCFLQCSRFHCCSLIFTWSGLETSTALHLEGCSLEWLSDLRVL